MSAAALKKDIEDALEGGKELAAFLEIELAVNDGVKAVAEAKSAAPGEDMKKKLTAAKVAQTTASEKATQVAKHLGTSRSAVIGAVKEKITRDFRERIRKMLVAAQSCDLCFVVDCTFSMDSFIKGVKEEIQGIVNELKASMEKLQLRLAFVGYRDVKDAVPFVIHGFDSSVSSFKAVLDEVKAEGGDDICEDVIGGLDKALQLNWQFANKVLVLCGDAPCHGKQYHTLTGYGADSYPEGLKMTSQPILKALQAKGVLISFISLNSSTDLMIRKFNEEIGQGEYITTDRLDRDAKDFASKVKASVSASLEKSFTKSMSAVSKGKSALDPAPKHKFLDSIAEGAESASASKAGVATRELDF